MSVLAKYPALHRPAFARYFAGQVLSGFGTWFQIIAQTLLILDLTASGTALGIAAALQFLPVLLLSPYAGVVADRYEARRILLFTNVAAALLALTLAIVAATHHATARWVWAMALGLGVVQAFDRPMQGAILAELVPPESRSNAVGLMSVQNASGRMVGPALAGILYARFGAAVCFFLNAASFLIIITALLTTRPDERIARVRKANTRAMAELRAGIAYVRATPALRGPLVCTFVVGAFAFNFLTMPALVTFTFHGDSRAFGICETLNAGAAVLGGLVIAPRLGRPTRHHLALAMGGMTVALAGNSVMPTLLTFALWMPVLGVLFILFQTTLQATLQSHASPAYLGRVMSLYTLGVFGTTPIGAPITGWLIDHVSPRAAMGMGAIATAGCGLWLWLATPHAIATTHEFAPT